MNNQELNKKLKKIAEAVSKQKYYTFADWFGQDLTGQTYEGNFDCSYTNITSLKGAPREVGEDFECHNTKITSLEGLPEKIGGKLYLPSQFKDKKKSKKKNTTLSLGFDSDEPETIWYSFDFKVLHEYSTRLKINGKNLIYWSNNDEDFNTFQTPFQNLDELLEYIKSLYDEFVKNGYTIYNDYIDIMADEGEINSPEEFVNFYKNYVNNSFVDGDSSWQVGFIDPQSMKCVLGSLDLVESYEEDEEDEEDDY